MNKLWHFFKSALKPRIVMFDYGDGSGLITDEYQEQTFKPKEYAQRVVLHCFDCGVIESVEKGPIGTPKASIPMPTEDKNESK